MSDFLRKSSAWLGRIQQASLATLVTYRRGGSGGRSCPWPATSAKTTQEAEDGGMMVSVLIADYIGPVATLLAGGIDMPPVSGDQIVEADGTVWELIAVPGEGHWRYSGVDLSRIRIHTKQVAAT